MVDIYSIVALEMSEFAAVYGQDYDLESPDQEVRLVTFTGGITWSDWGDLRHDVVPTCYLPMIQL